MTIMEIEPTKMRGLTAINDVREQAIEARHVEAPTLIAFIMVSDKDNNIYVTHIHRVECLDVKPVIVISMHV